MYSFCDTEIGRDMAIFSVSASREYLWTSLEGSGEVWKSLGVLGKLWNALDDSGRFPGLSL